MADDDLDMLQQLLEMAEDDGASDASDGRNAPFASGPTDQENLPANKRPRLGEAAKPLTAAFQPARRDSAGPASSSARLPAPQTKTGAVEKFSGLRMKNPCLPSIVLKERLSQMRFEKLCQARSKVGADTKWATIAVVTEKSTKESAKGSVYGIWRLSDLQGANVSLFLFGKAQTGLWKETEGSVVAVFNPEARIAEGKLSMSVDAEQQVVKLGTSTDMGFCRSRKKDGTPCRNAVNISACPFCDYHVQSEYNKIRSKRTECKDSRLHRAFQHADGSRLGASGRPRMLEGGDTVYAKPPSIKPCTQQQLQQTAAKARKHIPGASRLLSAMIPGQTAISQKHSPAAAVAAPAQYGPKTGSHAKLSRQASKRPQHLQGGSPSLQNLSQNPAYSFGSQAQSQASGQPRHVQPLSDARQQSRAAWGARQGGDPGGQQGSGRGRGATGAGLSAEEGSGPTEELMLLEEEVDWGGDGAGLGDPALQHALAVIRAKGGLKAPDPNRPFQSRPTPPLSQPVAATPSPPTGASQQSSDRQQHHATQSQQANHRQSSAAVTASQTGPGSGVCTNGGLVGAGLPLRGGRAAPQDRVLAKLGLSTGGHAIKAGQQAGRTGAAPQSTATPSGFAAAFGSIRSSQNAEQSDTRYKELVEDEDHERLTRVLTALEKKDEMQQRMEAITKLNVTAFQCKTCGTTSERRRPDCRQHDVQRVTATKRWWQCCHCSNRFSTVALRLPKERCPKCNDINMEFKAASMARFVKDKTEHTHASREAFKARGVEHSFAMNSQL